MDLEEELLLPEFAERRWLDLGCEICLVKICLNQKVPLPRGLPNEVAIWHIIFGVRLELRGPFFSQKRQVGLWNSGTEPLDLWTKTKLAT